MKQEYTFGYTKIKRGNSVKHIPVRTESIGHCGARLDRFYRSSIPPDELDNVCERCLASWKKNPRK